MFVCNMISLVKKRKDAITLLMYPYVSFFFSMKILFPTLQPVKSYPICFATLVFFHKSVIVEKMVIYIL